MSKINKKKVRNKERLKRRTISRQLKNNAREAVQNILLDINNSENQDMVISKRINPSKVAEVTAANRNDEKTTFWY